MRIVYITAGAGGMICGNCLRDNALARALIDLGHDVSLVPMYTPLRTDEPNVSLDEVFYGGLNVYLQQKSALFRRTPRLLDWLLDRPVLLRWVSRFALSTQPAELGELTVSVLRGEEGPQKKELIRLTAWLRELRPDVVHLTNSMVSGLAPLLKRQLRAAVVCSLQGEDYFLSNLPDPYRQQAYGLLKKMAESVDAFIAPCSDHANAMAPVLGIPAEQIRVAQPGLNPEGFLQRRVPAENEFVVGYLARVAPEKGLHTLTEAVHRLRERQKPGSRRVRLRAAGWLGPEHQEYLEQVRRNVQDWGSDTDFEYLGTLDRAAKLRFLQGLDALCVPVAYRAPKGQYVMEAWASGVPVVQPRSGVFPELIEATGGGVLFEPHDVEDLARSLQRLMDDPAAAARMGACGRAAVRERFHSRRMAEDTVAVYRQLLG